MLLSLHVISSFLGEASISLLFKVVLWRFPDLEVLRDFLLFWDSVDFVKFLEVLHLFISIDSVLLIKTSPTLLGNFLDLSLAEVSFCILDEKTEGDEWEKYETNHNFYFSLFLVFSLHVKVEIDRRLGQHGVTTGSKGYDLLSSLEPRHPVARLRSCF